MFFGRRVYKRKLSQARSTFFGFSAFPESWKEKEIKQNLWIQPIILIGTCSNISSSWIPESSIVILKTQFSGGCKVKSLSFIPFKNVVLFFETRQVTKIFCTTVSLVFSTCILFVFPNVPSQCPVKLFPSEPIFIVISVSHFYLVQSEPLLNFVLIETNSYGKHLYRYANTLRIMSKKISIFFKD